MRVFGVFLLLFPLACSGPVDEVDPPDVPAPPEPPEPPGAGRGFVVDSFAFSTSGFDLDDACDDDGCIDNQLGPFASVSEYDVVFGQALLGGEFILVFDLALLDTSFSGDDPMVDLRLYGARDADEPPFPLDNLRTPPGRDGCCRFHIFESDIEPTVPPLPRFRFPARIEDGRLRSQSVGRVEIPWPAQSAAPSERLRLEGASVSLRLSSDLSVVDEGLLGGTVTAAGLADVDALICRTVSPRCPISFQGASMLDMVAILGFELDMDVDGDGLECVRDLDGDGRIDLCCDGVPNAHACTWTGCAGTEVPPVDAADPRSCVYQPEIADGFSVAFEFTGVPATLDRLR